MTSPATDTETLPETSTSDELNAVALQIAAWQESRKLSAVELCKRYPGLGSTKTFARILRADLADLDVDRWAIEYGAVWRMICVADEAEAEAEDIYADLSTVRRVRVALIEAMRERGNNRFILVTGPSGSGKSKTVAAVRQHFGAALVAIEANETWRNSSVRPFLKKLLEGLGMSADKVPASAADALDEVVARLKSARVGVLIDEAHHLPPAGLNIVKTLLNQTPCQFVLLGMGTLWRRLETASYEEARQLTQNRMLERIKFEQLDEKDVALIVERRLKLTGEPLRRAVAAIAQDAPRHGYLGFVSLVCRHALRNAGGADATVDLEDFFRAIKQAINTR